VVPRDGGGWRAVIGWLKEPLRLMKEVPRPKKAPMEGKVGFTMTIRYVVLFSISEMLQQL
jgi:hypothetical protein